MNRNDKLAKVRDDREKGNSYEHVPTQISIQDDRRKLTNHERIPPDKNPRISIVDNRVDNRRVQNITINHNYQPHNNQQAYRQLGGERSVSFLLGVGIFFLPFIFAWFTLREGHSTLSRVVSFVWLALFMLSTCADVDERNDRVRPVKSGYETGV